MRRKDREITNAEEIDAIIRNCDCCRIGLSDGKKVYIVPLNFGFEHMEEGRIFYFHSAAEGRKLDLVRENGCAGFELDCSHELKTGNRACDCSYLYESVIGEGKISIITEENEKIHGLNEIMRQYTGNGDNDFSPEAVSRTVVLKLEVTEISCKKH